MLSLDLWKTHQLTNSPAHQLTNDQKLELRTRILIENETISARPNIIYYIKSGAVKITDQEDRLTQLVFENTTFEATEKDIILPIRTKTEIIWFNEEHLKVLADLRNRLLHDARQQKKLALELNKVLSLFDTKDKILESLHWMYECSKESKSLDRFEEGIPDFNKVPLYITLEQIAKMIGTTRVTVSRLLKELKEEKHVITRKDKLKFNASTANTTFVRDKGSIG